MILISSYIVLAAEDPKSGDEDTLGPPEEGDEEPEKEEVSKFKKFMIDAVKGSDVLAFFREGLLARRKRSIRLVRIGRTCFFPNASLRLKYEAKIRLSRI